MTRQPSLRLCPTPPRPSADDVARAIERVWARWHPDDRTHERHPGLDHHMPDRYVRIVADWFVERWWDEVVKLGITAEFRCFGWYAEAFPAMTSEWATLGPARRLAMPTEPSPASILLGRRRRVRRKRPSRVRVRAVD